MISSKADRKTEMKMSASRARERGQPPFHGNSTLRDLQSAFELLHKKTKSIEQILEYVAAAKSRYESAIDRREVELKMEIETLVRHEKAAIVDREKRICVPLWAKKSKCEAALYEISQLLKKWREITQQAQRDIMVHKEAGVTSTSSATDLVQKEVEATLNAIAPTLQEICAPSEQTFAPEQGVGSCRSSCPAPLGDLNKVVPPVRPHHQLACDLDVVNKIKVNPATEATPPEFDIVPESIPAWRLVIAPPEREYVQQSSSTKIMTKSSILYNNYHGAKQQPFFVASRGLVNARGGQHPLQKARPVSSKARKHKREPIEPGEVLGGEEVEVDVVQLSGGQPQQGGPPPEKFLGTTSRSMDPDEESSTSSVDHDASSKQKVLNKMSAVQPLAQHHTACLNNKATASPSPGPSTLLLPEEKKKYRSVSLIQGNAGLLNTTLPGKHDTAPASAHQHQLQPERPKSSKARKHKRVLIQNPEDDFVFYDTSTMQESPTSHGAYLLYEDTSPSHRSSGSSQGQEVVVVGEDNIVAGQPQASKDTTNAETLSRVNKICRSEEPVQQEIIGNTAAASNAETVVVQEYEGKNPAGIVMSPERDESNSTDNDDDFMVKGGSNAPVRAPPSEDDEVDEDTSVSNQIVKSSCNYKQRILGRPKNRNVHQIHHRSTPLVGGHGTAIANSGRQAATEVADHLDDRGPAAAKTKQEPKCSIIPKVFCPPDRIISSADSTAAPVAHGGAQREHKMKTNKCQRPGNNSLNPSRTTNQDHLRRKNHEAGVQPQQQQQRNKGADPSSKPKAITISTSTATRHQERDEEFVQQVHSGSSCTTSSSKDNKVLPPQDVDDVQTQFRRSIQDMMESIRRDDEELKKQVDALADRFPPFLTRLDEVEAMVETDQKNATTAIIPGGSSSRTTALAGTPAGAAVQQTSTDEALGPLYEDEAQGGTILEQKLREDDDPEQEIIRKNCDVDKMNMNIDVGIYDDISEDDGTSDSQINRYIREYYEEKQWCGASHQQGCSPRSTNAIQLQKNRSSSSNRKKKPESAKEKLHMQHHSCRETAVGATTRPSSSSSSMLKKTTSSHGQRADVENPFHHSSSRTTRSSLLLNNKGPFLDKSVSVPNKPRPTSATASKSSKSCTKPLIFGGAPVFDSASTMFSSQRHKEGSTAGPALVAETRTNTTNKNNVFKNPAVPITTHQQEQQYGTKPCELTRPELLLNDTTSVLSCYYIPDEWLSSSNNMSMSSSSSTTGRSGASPESGFGLVQLKIDSSRRPFSVGEVVQKHIQPLREEHNSPFTGPRRLTLCLRTHAVGTPIWLCDSECVHQALEDWKAVSDSSSGWPRLFIQPQW